jgi:hypothetical protein
LSCLNTLCSFSTADRQLTFAPFLSLQNLHPSTAPFFLPYPPFAPLLFTQYFPLCTVDMTPFRPFRPFRPSLPYLSLAYACILSKLCRQ